jgi:tryptophan 7-halogenase
MIGQNIIPRRYDPLVDGLDAFKVRSRLEELRAGIARSVESMPGHWDFIQGAYARQI